MAKKRLRNCLAVIVFIIIAFTLYNIFTSEPDSSVTELEDTTTVALLSQSELSNLYDSYSAFGTVQSTQSIDLVFQMNGTVKEVYVSPGAYLKEGDPIAILSNSSLASTVKQAEAGYDAAKSAYQIYENGADIYSLSALESQVMVAEWQLEALEDAGASDLEIDIQKQVVHQYRLQYEKLKAGASQDELDAQWASVRMAEAGLEAAKSAYELSILRAPFSGELVSLDIHPDDYAMATMPVGSFINRDSIEIVTYLSSEEADNISVGNFVLVNETYEAKVLGISSEVDSMTKKRKILLQIDSLYDLTVGDTVSLKIRKDKSPDITLVPITSVIFDDDASYVFFYFDGEVYKRRITTGTVLGDYVEVISMPNISIVEKVSGLRNGQFVELTL